MQESMLIVPNADNSGRDLSALRDKIASAMVDSFGGVTCRAATGMWKDSAGKLYREPVTELVSAADDTAATAATLNSLAHTIGREGRQPAVYVRYPSGLVGIVDTSNEQAANDNNAAG